jgi:diguanylate cyclase (GGDEF)-like protein/PAS domain S-box-containing protein
MDAVTGPPGERLGALAPAALAVAIIDAANDAIFAKTVDGIVLSWNRAAERIYGYRDDEIIGRSLAMLVPERLMPELTRLLERVARGELIEDYETVRRTKDGRQLDVSITVSPIHDSAGMVIGASTIARDITTRKRRARQMEHQALHDPLTSLANRAVAIEQLQAALARSARYSTRVAVLFIDLDEFKKINDRYGHLVGDHILRIVAHRIRHAVRAEDVVARFGGDEFLVVCGDVHSIDEADEIARRVAYMIARPLDLPAGVEQVVHASIGLRVSGPGDDPQEIIRDADEAMYRQKSFGRDQDATRRGH